MNNPKLAIRRTNNNVHHHHHHNHQSSHHHHKQTKQHHQLRKLQHHPTDPTTINDNTHHPNNPPLYTITSRRRKHSDDALSRHEKEATNKYDRHDPNDGFSCEPDRSGVYGRPTSRRIDVTFDYELVYDRSAGEGRLTSSIIPSLENAITKSIYFKIAPNCRRRRRLRRGRRLVLGLFDEDQNKRQSRRRMLLRDSIHRRLDIVAINPYPSDVLTASRCETYPPNDDKNACNVIKGGMSFYRSDSPSTSDSSLSDPQLENACLNAIKNYMTAGYYDSGVSPYVKRVRYVGEVSPSELSLGQDQPMSYSITGLLNFGGGGDGVEDYYPFLIVAACGLALFSCVVLAFIRRQKEEFNKHFGHALNVGSAGAPSSPLRSSVVTAGTMGSGSSQRWVSEKSASSKSTNSGNTTTNEQLNSLIRMIDEDAVSESSSSKKEGSGGVLDVTELAGKGNDVNDGQDPSLRRSSGTDNSTRNGFDSTTSTSGDNWSTIDSLIRLVDDDGEVIDGDTSEKILPI